MIALRTNHDKPTAGNLPPTPEDTGGSRTQPVVPPATSSHKTTGVHCGTCGCSRVGDQSLKSIAYQAVAAVLAFFAALYFLAEGGLR